MASAMRIKKVDHNRNYTNNNMPQNDKVKNDEVTTIVLVEKKRIY